MKKANVNTVRTSHYPRQAKMYAMFDYYGLYCMNEADVALFSFKPFTTGNFSLDFTTATIKYQADSGV